ncbi:MAG: hypothetical protein U0R19_24865 [Bryobacteraceae bacterium]
MELVTETPDLLTLMLRNRTMRNLIAIAIVLTALDTIYATGKDFVRGFQEGRNFANHVQRSK